MLLTSSKRPDPSQFKVKGFLANTHLQSLLSSSKLRKHLTSKQAVKLIANQQDYLFDGGNGIRLHGLYSAHANKQTKLIILIHGWEGSADSTYLLSAASALYNQGYSILRLHLRDHGPSAHLNPGLFHAVRLDEVINALKDAQSRLTYRHCYLVGFSLGGNFALRIGQQAVAQGLSLKHIVAISPVFSPKQTMNALETGPAMYRFYFLKKWKRALKAKQQIFPEHYQFGHLLNSKSLMALTHHLVDKHTEFETVDEYFNGYTLHAKDFEETPFSTDVILAADDPVIPVSGTEAFSSSENFRLRIFRQGGHCGFIQNWRFESWLDQELIRLFTDENK